MIDTQQLHRVIEEMKRTHILVIGDVMLDMYEHCVVKRISPEAPVPVAQVVSDSYFLGGAGNVANNARAVGATVSLVSVVGNDQEGTLVRALLQENGIDFEGVVTEIDRRTTLKKRIVSGTQQLIRVDREDTHDVTPSTEDAFLLVLQQKIKICDAIIISDYCKGLLTNSLVAFIQKEARLYDKKILVDSKHKDLSRYAGVHVIKPNKSEAETFAGELFAHDYVNLSEIGARLSSTLETNLVVTLGSDGIALFSGDQFHHIKTNALQVFDVSGAGDTVLSVMGTALASGAKLYEAVHLSNMAAGHVVSRLGTTVCDRETLKEIIGNEQ
jgi:rfaE bifunctional protein kinase chain/domain